MAGNVPFRYFGSALCNTNDRARISQLILSCLIECWFRGHSYRITLHKDSWNKAIFYAWEMCLLYISGLDVFFLLVHKPHIKLPWVLASCWVKATKCERVIRSRENRGICDVGVKKTASSQPRSAPKCIECTAFTLGHPARGGTNTQFTYYNIRLFIYEGWTPNNPWFESVEETPSRLAFSQLKQWVLFFFQLCHCKLSTAASTAVLCVWLFGWQRCQQQ